MVVKDVTGRPARRIGISQVPLRLRWLNATANTRGIVVITRYGKPVAVYLAAWHYDMLVQSLSRHTAGRAVDVR